MALPSLPGWAVLPLAVLTIVLAALKTWRVRSLSWYAPLALLQAAAVAISLLALAGPLFPLAAAGGASAAAPFLLAAAGAATATLLDLTVSLRFILTAATPDRSLNARTSILLSLMPAALAMAAMFSLSWAWPAVRYAAPAAGAAAYPPHALFALAGAGLVLLFVAAAAAVAAAPAPGGGVRGDRCARVWFLLMFCCAPVSAIVTGVAALLAPVPVRGGFVQLHVVLGVGVVTLATALMRDMLNNGAYVDPMGGGAPVSDKIAAAL